MALRTTIYLNDQLQSHVDKETEATGKPVNAIIQEALTQRYEDEDYLTHQLLRRREKLLELVHSVDQRLEELAQ